MPAKKGGTVLQVFVFKDGDFIGNEVFSERRIVVGRDQASADLVLDSEQVSRAHALIEHDGERVTVRDTESTNGVFLNGDKITAVEVGRMDEVVIGDFSLKLKLITKGKEPLAEAPEPTRVLQAPKSEPKTSARRERVEVSEDESAVARRESAKAAARAPAPAPEHEATVIESRAALADEPTRVPEPEPIVTRAKPAEKAKAAKAKEPALEHPKAREPSAAPVIAAPESKPRAPAKSFDFAALQRPRWVAADEHDDDHDPEEERQGDFSLTDVVMRTSTGAPSDDKQAPHLEVLTLRGDSLAGASLVAPGEAFWIGHEQSWLKKRKDLRQRMRLLRYKRTGTECVVEFPVAARGTVRRAGKPVELASVAKEKKRGLMRAVLQRGEELELVDAPHHYRVRWVYPPTVPVDKRPWHQRLRPEKTLERSMVGSFGGHLIVLILGLLIPAHTVPPPSDTETFAEVTLDKDLKLEEPEAPPPTPETPPTPEPAPKPVPKRMEAAPKKAPKTGGTAKAPPGVLGLLSKTGSSAAPGPAAALAAVSNLSAANAPAGAAGFRVSGLVGKLPTSDLSIGGGGGGVVTKGGAALLRGGGGGAGALSGKGDRAVGGQVIKMPQAMRSTGQGSLDRDAIQKVINQNIGQIQRCYERELLKTPGLEGKVEIEWVIGTSGTVKSTRQKFADLASSAAVSCMLGAIKGWRFPQPQGGDVSVSYPFVFKPIGF